MRLLVAVPMLLSLCLPAATAAAPEAQEMAVRYERAARHFPDALSPLVRNDRVQPNWIGPGSDFWYRRQSAEGDEVRLVRGADGSHSRSTEPAAPAQPVARDPRLLPSPDGSLALFARDHDLWLRRAKDGTETRLTADGAAFFAWGKLPDALFMTLANQRQPRPMPPFGMVWSPDSRYVLASRLDERSVKPYPFLESVPQDGSFTPIVRTIRVPLLGEPSPALESVAIDTQSGRRVPLANPAGSSAVNVLEVLGWSADGGRFYTSVTRAQPRGLDLVEVDVATGRSRAVVAENAAGFIGLNALLYSAPNVRLVNGGREILWYSQRSGWGHLYRYELASGKLLNAVTAGDWLVRDILAVDEARRRIVFTASGREAGNPYWRRVYRVNYDGSDLRLLTPEAADHMLDGAPVPLISMLFGLPTPPSAVSPDGKVFVDTHSTLTAPPVTVLRRVEDGQVLNTLERADISALLAAGWRAPEPFTAKAADGKTDLHGVIYWPDAAMGDKVPLIDTLYGGPQTSDVPHNFASAVRGRYNGSAYNVLGFATMVLDGRATPLRSQAFQDTGFPNFGDVATDDHAAVVKQLLARHPRLDGRRVGVTGHSFGGYVSVRAMLRHPEVFQVGVSSAGPHLYAGSYSTAGFLGDPDYGQGQTLRPVPSANPANYRAMDNIPLAAQLRGRLLLGIGEHDENAYPAMTWQLIDALTKAGLRYDLVVLPNTTHNFGRYFNWRRIDYFVEHLLGAALPTKAYPR